MLNDHRVSRADLKAVSLNAFAQEELKGLIIADVKVVHLDALASPEVIKMLFAEPLLGRLGVELVFSLEQHALVVLHMLGKLIIAGHGVAK